MHWESTDKESLLGGRHDDDGERAETSLSSQAGAGRILFMSTTFRANGYRVIGTAIVEEELVFYRS